MVTLMPLVTGHCHLMQDDLQKAYAAYQQALYLLPNPKVRACVLSVASMFADICPSETQKDPKLWYGIGILYDRYGSLDHAEEAFSSVLRMDKGTRRSFPAMLLRALMNDMNTHHHSRSRL